MFTIIVVAAGIVAKCIFSNSSYECWIVDLKSYMPLIASLELIFELGILKIYRVK